MKEKSIKNIRKEFKENGIFYTPPELAEKLKSYVDIEPETVYEIIIPSLIQGMGKIKKCALAV